MVSINIFVIETLCIQNFIIELCRIYIRKKICDQIEVQIEVRVFKSVEGGTEGATQFYNTFIPDEFVILPSFQDFHVNYLCF